MANLRKARSGKAAKPKQGAGRFVQAGRLEWALLVPVGAARLESEVVRLEAKLHGLPFELDEGPSSRCVLKGSKRHSALIETEPGSSRTETELAAALSKDLKAIVYALGFAGYDDPDYGLPYIQRYRGGKSELVWMAPSDEAGEEELETVRGPSGVPSSDPFEFADALGCKLRRYFELPASSKRS